MFAAEHLAYHHTGAFSKIVLDYLEGSEALRPYYLHPPTEEGIRAAIRSRDAFPTNRQALVNVLNMQYEAIPAGESVHGNIASLLSRDTYTICTAHQPNLFTGPLYFIYKILHAIRLAKDLSDRFPGKHFVPVFYMGSEDADFEELNNFSVEGKKYKWDTAQTGAVGRMQADAALQALITELEQQVGIHPFGKAWTSLLRDCFSKGRRIQDATFRLVHALFGQYGLVVLIADAAPLKAIMQPVFADDLFEHIPSEIVTGTCNRLSAHYNVQAHPRPVNLFYLADNLRERIEEKGEGFTVCNTTMQYAPAEIRNLLQEQPELFSPNVILRGLFQETILPNAAFIGGGGELAYWLQLKDLFKHYSVPFPVLVLRNSFTIVPAALHHKIDKLELAPADLFKPVTELLDQQLEKEGVKPSLNGAVKGLNTLYEQIGREAGAADASLDKHVRALQKQAVGRIEALEQKMLRAARRKEAARLRQLAQLKETLFPGNGLQERADNIALYYARWGPAFIDALLACSAALEQRFTVLYGKD